VDEKKKYVTVIMLKGTGQLGFISELNYEEIKNKLKSASDVDDVAEFVGEDPKIGTVLNICIDPDGVLAFYVSEFHTRTIATPQLMS